MRYLDNRYAAITAGLESIAWGKYGIVKLNVSADALGNSGFQGKASYMLMQNIGKSIVIFPEAGLRYYSNKHNRYFFGVSQEESLNTGFNQYSPSASITPYVGVSAVVSINKNVKSVLMGHYGILPSKIKDSPIVDKDKELSFYINLTYEF
ncbi:outer membrane scaffolding protein for murein synthesis (MipA/OmpV family) [Elusimicrobium simillimum]